MRLTVFSLVLPTLLPFLLSMLLQVIDVDIRRAYPFIRLARGPGGTAEDTVCLDYVNKLPHRVMWNAGKNGHWIVLLSTVLYCLSISGLTFLSAYYFKRYKWSSGEYSEDLGEVPVLVIIHTTSTVVTLVSITLATIITGLLLILWQCATSKTGVRYNPTTIIGLAALARDKSIGRDFAQFSSWISTDELDGALKGRVYHLKISGNSKTESILLPMSDQLVASASLCDSPAPDSWPKRRFWWARGHPWGLQLVLFLPGPGLLYLWVILVGTGSVPLPFETRKAITLAFAIAARFYCDMMDRG